jgi:hypothetical protein
VNASTRFRVNKPRVVHETIDNEVVLIDFDTGSYYSLDRVGADVWGFVESGATLCQIVDGIACRYDGDHGNMEAAVRQLLAELLQENLVVPDETGEAENIENHTTRGEAAPQTKRPGFEVPFLQKYTDMQELLLLDPIHEVDETGWPSIKPDVPAVDS